MTYSIDAPGQSTVSPPSSDESPYQQRGLDGYLRREELAHLLGVSERTIDRWHILRCGPPRICVGRTILYKLASVHEWLGSMEQSTNGPADLA